jgi:O-antigen/teichoic acid export membrane protein
MGLAATIIFIIAAPWLESVFNIPDLGRLLSIASLSFPFVTMNNAFVSYLNAVRKMKLYAAFEIYRKGIILAFTLLFVWMGYGIQGAIMALVVAPISVTIIQEIYHRKLFNYTFKRYKECTKRLFAFGSKLFADSIVGMVNTNLAIFLIGFYLLDSDVGIYAIATMFFTLLVMVPSAIQKIAYPALSEYYSKQKFPSMKKLMETTMRFSFVFISIICFILIFFVDDIISLIFPGKPIFLNAIAAFRIIAVMGLLYMSIMPSSVVFSSMGRPDIPLKITTLNLIINITCCVILIPRDISLFGLQLGGINGAAIAYGISMLFSSIALIILVKRLVPIDIQFGNIIAGILSFIISIVLSYVAVTKFSLDGNIVGAIVIAIFSVCLYYFGIVTFGGFKTAVSILKNK